MGLHLSISFIDSIIDFIAPSLLPVIRLMTKTNLFLTLSAQETKIDIYANSVDPDEMACNEPSHLDLHCLLFCYWFLTESPICIGGHVQIQGWKSPLQTLSGEIVKELGDVGGLLTLSCWTRICPAFTNSVDPDQLAAEEANWFGSAVFVI